MALRTDDAALLPCGVDATTLVEQVADGVEAQDVEHQRTCPYCQEALADLRAAFGQLRDLAGEHVRAPRGLSTRVMDRIRRERRRVVVASGPGGVDTVSDVIVAQVARRAAVSVDAVRFASVVAEPQPDGTVDVAVHVTADLGPALPRVAEAVRATVLEHVEVLVGPAGGRVDVTIDDVA